MQAQQKFHTQTNVAGRGARLDHGGALPVLPHAFIINGSCLQGDGNLCGAGIGAQAQVNAKAVAVFRDVLQNRDQPLGQAHKECGGLDAFRHRCGFRIIENNEIDIAGVIQFTGAVLAHGERHIAAVARWIFLVDTAKFSGARGIEKKPVDRGPQHGVGKARERRRHLVDGPDFSQIGEGNEKRSLCLGMAQGHHDFSLAQESLRGVNAGAQGRQQVFR